MSNAARCDRDASPEPPRDLPAEAAALIPRAEAAIAAVADDPGNDRAVNELALCNIRSAQLAAALRDAAAGQAALAAARVSAAATERARLAAAARDVPARRRAPALRRPALTVVPA